MYGLLWALREVRLEVAAGEWVALLGPNGAGKTTLLRLLAALAYPTDGVIELFGREMIFLRDLGSTNGTYHNGQRVSVSRLRNGDTIGVGRSVLKLDIRT